MRTAFLSRPGADPPAPGDRFDHHVAGADALVTSAGGGAPTVETIAADGGGSTPVVELYEGGVGPADGEQAGYAEAMLHNARVLADALGE